MSDLTERIEERYEQNQERGNLISDWPQTYRFLIELSEKLDRLEEKLGGDQKVEVTFPEPAGPRQEEYRRRIQEWFRMRGHIAGGANVPEYSPSDVRKPVQTDPDAEPGNEPIFDVEGLRLDEASLDEALSAAMRKLKDYGHIGQHVAPDCPRCQLHDRIAEVLNDE